MEQAKEALQTGDEWTPKTFNVKVWTDANGEPMMQEVTLEELQNGYLRQSDYTKKTQELAEERKVLEANASKAQEAGYQWDPNDDEAVEAYLQAKGYAKADTVKKIVEQELKWLTKAQQDEQAIQGLLTSNPDLKQFEWAIRKIAATDDSAIEDIVVKYGFSNHDKLSKAKERDVRGWSMMTEKKEKSVNEMSPKEWEEYKSKIGSVSSFR